MHRYIVTVHQQPGRTLAVWPPGFIEVPCQISFCAAVRFEFRSCVIGRLAQLTQDTKVRIKSAGQRKHRKRICVDGLSLICKQIIRNP